MQFPLYEFTTSCSAPMVGSGFSEPTGMLPMLIVAGDRAEPLHCKLRLGSALRLEE